MKWVFRPNKGVVGKVMVGQRAPIGGAYEPMRTDKHPIFDLDRQLPRPSILRF
jgi:hypothetical protein